MITIVKKLDYNRFLVALTCIWQYPSQVPTWLPKAGRIEHSMHQ